MKRTPKIHVFRNAADQWVWHLRSGNGRIVCQGESHATKRDARRAAQGVIAAAKVAVFVD